MATPLSNLDKGEGGGRLDSPGFTFGVSSGVSIEVSIALSLAIPFAVPLGVSVGVPFGVTQHRALSEALLPPYRQPACLS